MTHINDDQIRKLARRIWYHNASLNPVDVMVKFAAALKQEDPDGQLVRLTRERDLWRAEALAAGKYLSHCATPPQHGAYSKARQARIDAGLE